MSENYQVDVDKYEIQCIAHALHHLNRAFVIMRKCRIKEDAWQIVDEIRHLYEITSNVLIEREGKNITHE